MKKLIFSTVLMTVLLLTATGQDVVAQSAQRSTATEHAMFKKTPPNEQQMLGDEQKKHDKEQAENAKNLKKGQLIPITTKKTKLIREGREAKK